MWDLRRLQFFVTVAEMMNVSRAAEVLHISQSALSRQVQGLEEEIGVQLFDRVGKRLVLTVEGEELLPRAARLLEQAAALSARTNAVARGQIGHLRIGATPQTIASLFAPALAAFRASHPGVDVTLMEGHNEALIEMVDRGTVHLSVASPSEPHHFAGEPLFVAELLTFLPPGDPRIGTASLPIESLANDPLLLLRRGFMTRDLFETSCQRIGFRPRVVLESDSPHTLVALVEAGHGLAVLSSSAALGTRSGPPVPLTLNGAPIRRLVSAIWNPARHRPAALPFFIQHLKTFAHVRGRRGYTLAAETAIREIDPADPISPSANQPR